MSSAQREISDLASVDSTAIENESDHALAQSAHATVPTHREIFVSPRVVDAAAFEQFAGTLRALIRDASVHTAALTAAAAAATAAQQRATTASDETTKRAESATKLITLIDQRLDKAQQVAATVSKDLVARLNELRTFTGVDVLQLSERIKATAQSAVSEVVAAAVARASASIAESQITAIAAVSAAAEQARSACTTAGSTANELANAAQEITSQASAAFAAAAEQLTSTVESNINSLSERITANQTACEAAAGLAQEATVLLQEALGVVDITSLSRTVLDAQDAIEASTRATLTLREATALGANAAASISPAIQDVQAGQQMVLELSQLVARGDLIGKGLVKLLNLAKPTNSPRPPEGS